MKSDFGSESGADDCLQMAASADSNNDNKQVASSHELSKRRFFERLERRDSIKKLTFVQLSTNRSQPLTNNSTDSTSSGASSTSSAADFRLCNRQPLASEQLDSRLMEEPHQLDPIYNNLYCPPGYQIPRARPLTEDSARKSQLRGWPLIVENHNYASLGGSSRTCSASSDASIVLEPDDQLLVEGYVNLPALTKAPAARSASYATLRSCALRFRQLDEVNQNKKEKSEADDKTHKSSSSNLSSSSTSSRSSGSAGFSLLKPVTDERPPIGNIDNVNHGDDCDPTEGQYLRQLPVVFPSGGRKSSILKRFGHLVSRAFTVGVQKQTDILSATSCELNRTESCKIKSQDSQVHQVAAENDLRQMGPARDEMDQKQLAPSKEQNRDSADDRVVANQQADSPGLISTQSPRLSFEPDLVILPTKHSKLRYNRPHLVASASKQQKQINKESTTTNSLSRTLDRRQAARSSKWHSKSSDSMFGDQESLFSRSSEAERRSGSRSLVRLTNSLSSDSLNSQQRIKITSSDTKRADDSAKACRSPQTDCNKLKPIIWDGNECKGRVQQQQPSSFWGLSSLISYNHVISGPRSGKFEEQANRVSGDKKNGGSSTERKWRKRCFKLKSEPQEPKSKEEQQENRCRPSDLIYCSASLSSMQPLGVIQNHKQQADLFQSLDEYERCNNNYSSATSRLSRKHRDDLTISRPSAGQHSPPRHRPVARCGNQHHNHNHHHHSHSHHHHHCASRNRQNHELKGGRSSCQLITGASSDGQGLREDTLVWGQLIKIKKTDGSQLIELHRAPGKSWGFFVARGAINNVKGIFISRMHDKITSNSLTGLLSIGDRILAIDDCSIGPEHDILRVNQMISKKTKIMLRVKPFKG